MHSRNKEATAAKMLFLDVGISSTSMINVANTGASMVERLNACCPGWNAAFERKVAEADAAQGLILNHGASPLALMRAAKNGCVLARAEVQLLPSGKSVLAIPVGKPQSLTCPLAIQMLIHFYAVREPYIDRPISQWPPAQREIVEGFKAERLIFERAPNQFGATSKGAKLVAILKAAMVEGLKNV